MLLCDTQISLSEIVEPFEPEQIRKAGTSYGLSSYGYDVRIGNEFVTFLPSDKPLSPETISERDVVRELADKFVLQPGAFVLAVTAEYLRMPPDVTGLVCDKSSWARCGLSVQNTVLEACFSDDTEILTPDGWKPIKSVSVGDKVMGIDEFGDACYQPVLKKQDYPYSGNLMHFDGRSVDLAVTPDHKLFVRKRTNTRPMVGDGYTPWHTEPADQVFGKHNYEFSREVRWRGVDPGQSMKIGAREFPTMPLLRFLGHWLGDGSSYSSRAGYLIKLAAFKERKIKDFSENLDALGVKYAFEERGLRFHSKEIFEWLFAYRGAENKSVPREVFTMTPQHIAEVLRGLMESDGCATSNTITTVSTQLADDIQILAFLSGKAAIVRKRKMEERVINGSLAIPNYDINVVRISDGHMTPCINVPSHKYMEYEGRVYDVTVPNHVIFVRRNGKAVWSGNCWHGEVTLELHNQSPRPLLLTAGQGIAQVLFVRGMPCATTYADRAGRYQGQRGVTLPRRAAP